MKARCAGLPGATPRRLPIGTRTRWSAILSVLLLVALPLGATADPAAIPADADWALVTPAAGAGARTAAELAGLADTRGLQQGFAAGIARGLGVDPFDPAALEAAGIDPAAPLAFGSRGGVELAALQLRAGDDGGSFARWLDSLGEVESAGPHGGWQIQLVRSGGRPAAALARKGAARITARLVEPRGDLLATLRRAIDGHARAGGLAKVPLFRAAAAQADNAPWTVWWKGASSQVAIGLRPRGRHLDVSGRVSLQQPLGPVSTEAAWPQAALPSDLLLARLHLAPASRPQVAQQIAHLLARICGTCTAEQGRAAGQTLARLLAGPAALAIHSVDVPFLVGDRDPAELPFAWLAQTTDPAAARTQLAALAQRLGAEGTGPWSVTTGRQAIHFGLQGDRLYVASDRALGERLLAATSGPARGPGDPLAITIAPPAIDRALAGLGLGDAMRGGARGTLFAIRLQLGPLLRASGPFELGARPMEGGVLQVRGSWLLRRDP